MERLKLCRYPVDYRPGWAALLPHLNHLQKCAALEMSRGVLAEQANNIADAIDCIKAILGFSASLESEPDVISVIVQHKLDHHASELLRWLLNHRELTSQQIANLQEIFQGAERTNRLERALVGERCFTLALFNSSSGGILDALDPGYENRLGAILGIHIWRVSGALKKDEIRFLERVEEAREAIGLPLTRGLARADELRQAIT